MDGPRPRINQRDLLAGSPAAPPGHNVIRGKRRPSLGCLTQPRPVLPRTPVALQIHGLHLAVKAFLYGVIGE